MLRSKPVIVPGGSDRLVRLVLVGCGGTGSWLSGGIARVAWELQRMGRQVEVQFWDFDKIEPQNVPRQCFSPAEIGLHKAEVLALRYGAAWGIPITTYLQPFDPRKLGLGDHYGYSYNRPVTILLGAVDNAAARRTLAQALDSNENNRQAPAIWHIDCGNSKSSCQVLIGSHNKVEDLREAFSLSCNALPSPTLQHPELLDPLPEELPGAGERMSCAELVAVNAQSMTINKLAASLAEEVLVRLLTGKLTYFAVYADQESGTVRARYTNPDEIAAAIGKTAAFFPIHIN
ncbi:MAG TPA: ThiF family adenylyltransferase [Chloroflexia bacterium]|nr:ThiF family adenylyltransferase [Chloroflexia bacterium]